MKKKSIQRSFHLLSIVLIANISICSQGQPQTQFPLHDAAKRGDLAAVMSLYEQGVPMDAVEYIHVEDTTPLHVAAEHGHLPVVKFLAGIIDIDATDGWNQTPFLLACSFDHLDIAKYLFGLGADINVGDSCYCTPLHWACWNGHLAIVNFLVQNGAEIHVLNGDSSTPLHCAAVFGHHHVVAYLCAIVSKDLSRYNTGLSPLHEACWNLRVQTAKILVECDADVNAASDQGSTPLHYAVAADSAAPINHADKHILVSYLLSQGAQIDVVDDDGDAVVHSGICTVSPEVLTLLWRRGANFDLKNDARQTPVDKLFEAIKNTGGVYKKEELLERAAFLVRFGIFINKKHKKILEAENQTLLEQWEKTATDEQKKQMLKYTRPVYLQLILEEKERLLKNDLVGTYVEALPRDLQGLLLKFVVSQTERKRVRDRDGSDDTNSNKKQKTLSS